MMRLQQHRQELPIHRTIAFSSEVDTGSREENASKQKIRASVLIQSEPKSFSDHATTHLQHEMPCAESDRTAKTATDQREIRRYVPARRRWRRQRRSRSTR